MNKILTLVFFISCAVLYSCKKDNIKGSPNATIAGNKLAPDGFNFSTTKNVKLNLTLQTNGNKPLSGIMVNVYLPNNTANGQAVFRGMTNKSGAINATITVPSYATQLILDPNTAGILRMATANITNNSITATLGGKSVYSGDIIGTSMSLSMATSPSHNLKNNNLSIPITFPDGYDASNAFTSPTNLGCPNWLSSSTDNIDPTLISYINASLPEGQDLSVTHPQYIDDKPHVLNITNKSDIWITYVSSYAANRNVLGYYTYPTSNPPTSVSDISKITLIFPNCSMTGNRGGMNPGDKTKIGTFDAGTSIGFVLVSDGWDGSTINTAMPTFFSQKNFNPELDPVYQQHCVVLYDATHKLDLISFEDETRGPGEPSDSDFNDVIFYATANDISDIDNGGVPPIDQGCPDSDGDGVDDCHDQFPSDPGKAYTSYYPCQSCFANVAFEDNWPNKGDYDLNDMVVNYQYEFISNAQNQVVSMIGKFSLAAAGASFKNGFGIQLPVAAGAVSSVTGEKLSNGSYIQLAGNGTESGQSKAVIIPFDNHDLMAHNADYSFFINTMMSKDKVTSDTATVTINFTSPVDPNVLTPSAFNPFLISNLRRGYEVHLPGFQPTDKADSKLFGSGDDNSNPATGKYYLTSDNWPWALNYVQVFNYPVETVNITQAYLHFSDWASSGGTLYPDWYSNSATGYRNNIFIYSK